MFSVAWKSCDASLVLTGFCFLILFYTFFGLLRPLSSSRPSRSCDGLIDLRKVIRRDFYLLPPSLPALLHIKPPLLISLQSRKGELPLLLPRLNDLYRDCAFLLTQSCRLHSLPSYLHYPQLFPDHPPQDTKHAVISPSFKTKTKLTPTPTPAKPKPIFCRRLRSKLRVEDSGASGLLRKCSLRHQREVGSRIGKRRRQVKQAMPLLSQPGLDGELSTGDYP